MTIPSTGNLVKSSVRKSSLCTSVRTHAEKQGVVAHTCDPSTDGVATGGTLRLTGQPV